MLRTEQRQGVRMLKLRDVLTRWEAGSLSQLEAAEIVGMSERSFRRWTRRFEEEGEDGLLDRRLGRRSGRVVPEDEADEVGRLYRERYAGFTAKHFHEHLVRDHGFRWGYSWTKTYLQSRGYLARAPRRAPSQAAAPAADRDDAASRRVAARLARWPRAARPGDHPGRRHERDLLGGSGRGGGHGLELPAACRDHRGAWAALLARHRPGQPLRPHPGGGRSGGEGDLDAGRPRAGPTRDRAHSGLFAGGARPLRAGLPHPSRQAAERAGAGRDYDDRGRPRLLARGLPAGPQRPLRHQAGRRRLGLRAGRGGAMARPPGHPGGAHGRAGQHRQLERAASADPASSGKSPFRQGQGADPRLPGWPSRHLPRTALPRLLASRSGHNRPRLSLSPPRQPLSRRADLWGRPGRGSASPNPPTNSNKQSGQPMCSINRTSSRARYSRLAPSRTVEGEPRSSRLLLAGRFLGPRLRAVVQVRDGVGASEPALKVHIGAALRAERRD